MVLFRRLKNSKIVVGINIAENHQLQLTWKYTSAE